jgi:hypothetical protein
MHDTYSTRSCYEHHTPPVKLLHNALGVHSYLLYTSALADLGLYELQNRRSRIALSPAITHLPLSSTSPSDTQSPLEYLQSSRAESYFHGMVERPATSGEEVYTSTCTESTPAERHTTKSCSSATDTSSTDASVPECVLRAIYPERYATAPDQQSKPIMPSAESIA